MTQIERARKEREKLVESINKIVSDKINRFCKKYNVSPDQMYLRTNMYGHGIKDIDITINYEQEYDNRNK